MGASGCVIALESGGGELFWAQRGVIGDDRNGLSEAELMNRWRWPRTSLVSVLSLLGIAVVMANEFVGPRLYPTYRMLVPSVLATLSVAALLIFGTWESVRRRIRNCHSADRRQRSSESATSSRRSVPARRSQAGRSGRAGCRRGNRRPQLQSFGGVELLVQ
jgi:hypothetical protein